MVLLLQIFRIKYCTHSSPAHVYNVFRPAHSPRSATRVSRRAYYEKKAGAARLQAWREFRVRISSVQTIFYSPHLPRPTLGPSQLNLNLGPGPFLRVKWRGCRTDHPPLLRPKLKMDHTSNSPLSLQGLVIGWPWTGNFDPVACEMKSNRCFELFSKMRRNRKIEPNVLNSAIKRNNNLFCGMKFSPTALFQRQKCHSRMAISPVLLRNGSVSCFFSQPFKATVRLKLQIGLHLFHNTSHTPVHLLNH